MYDTFGDKRTLFLQALELYVMESVRSTQAELKKAGSPLSAVTNALVTFAERKDMTSAEGCMGLNAISEFGERDADVTRITRIATRSQRDTLIRVLKKAKAHWLNDLQFSGSLLKRITTPKGKIVRQGLKIRFFPVRAGHRVPKTERTRAETLEADRVRK